MKQTHVKNAKGVQIQRGREYIMRPDNLIMDEIEVDHRYQLVHSFNQPLSQTNPKKLSFSWSKSLGNSTYIGEGFFLSLEPNIDLLSFFFFVQVAQRLEKFTLKVNKWGVWGSNPSPCINMHYPLPSVLSSRGLLTFSLQPQDYYLVLVSKDKLYL